MAKPVLFETSNGVGRITLNRPDVRNALDESMIAALDERLRALRDDVQTRVVLISGAGGAFCGGLDIAEVKDIEDAVERRRAFAPIARRLVRLLSRTLDRVASLEQVTIAAMDGYAVGGGFSLALACDLRIASDRAQCWFPEVDLGVPLSPASTALLAAHCGAGVAKEIVLTCRRLSARDLESLGLVNRVVDAEVLPDAALQLANQVAGKHREAVAVSKATIDAVTRISGVVRTDLVLPGD